MGRVAVVGGRGDAGPLDRTTADVVMFGSPGDAGSGETRRLDAAIRAGSFTAVFILARWGAHSATNKIRQACRSTGTRIVIWPGGLSSLAVALAEATP